jgi:hypothetical protein
MSSELENRKMLSKIFESKIQWLRYNWTKTWACCCRRDHFAVGVKPPCVVLRTWSTMACSRHIRRAFERSFLTNTWPCAVVDNPLCSVLLIKHVLDPKKHARSLYFQLGSESVASATSSFLISWNILNLAVLLWSTVDAWSWYYPYLVKEGA